MSPVNTKKLIQGIYPVQAHGTSRVAAMQPLKTVKPRQAGHPMPRSPALRRQGLKQSPYLACRRLMYSSKASTRART